MTLEDTLPTKRFELKENIDYAQFEPALRNYLKQKSSKQVEDKHKIIYSLNTGTDVTLEKNPDTNQIYLIQVSGKNQWDSYVLSTIFLLREI